MSSDNDLARAAWAAMQVFVQGADRRRALHAELGIGNDKAELLISLARAPMTLREISRAFDVDPSAATVAADRLERRGFVRREAHPDDRRSKLVSLTDKGRQAAATAHRIITDPPAALRALDADRLAALTRILADLTAEHPQP
ncbi:MarR family transcriptional regulator [Dactylosporangium sp. McL0621]|uniref:MarR family transcriptional regulator n=1 Tax=Dactylosporangium sp. McL0621 TaxID=3415678 RepID=UPI003CE9F3EB